MTQTRPGLSEGEAAFTVEERAGSCGGSRLYNVPQHGSIKLRQPPQRDSSCFWSDGGEAFRRVPCTLGAESEFKDDGG